MGWRYVEFEEFFGVIDGILNIFFEFFFDGFEIIDIFLVDVGNFDNGNFVKSGGVGYIKGEVEVFYGYIKRVEDFGIDGIFV